MAASNAAFARPPPPIQVTVSNRIIQQLRVWSEAQDCIVAAYVTTEHFDTFITTSVVVKHVIGDYSCRIIPDDDSNLILYMRLPSPSDVEKFHGHAWYWWREYVFFRHISRLEETLEWNMFNDAQPRQLHLSVRFVDQYACIKEFVVGLISS